MNAQRALGLLLAMMSLAGCSTESAAPLPPSNSTPMSATCISGDLSYSIDSGDELALDVTVVNAGARICEIKGYPIVSFAQDDRGIAVGVSAEQQPAKIETVELAPGAATHVTIQVRDPDRYGRDCEPVHANGLRVTPPEGQAWKFLEYPMVVCTSVTTPMLKVWPVGVTPDL